MGILQKMFGTGKKQEQKVKEDKVAADLAKKTGVSYEEALKYRKRKDRTISISGTLRGAAKAGKGVVDWIAENQRKSGRAGRSEPLFTFGGGGFGKQRQQQQPLITFGNFGNIGTGVKKKKYHKKKKSGKTITIRVK